MVGGFPYLFIGKAVAAERDATFTKHSGNPGLGYAVAIVTSSVDGGVNVGNR
jgi:hypothetical protein